LSSRNGTVFRGRDDPPCPFPAAAGGVRSAASEALCEVSARARA